jgi:DNA-binding transcriptional MerR regulator
MNEATVPGTVIPYSKGNGMFSVFIPMIKATGGLSLSQVCAITGLEASAIQNWVKRGFVAHPVNKKYFERQLARILLISALRSSMKIESIGELMHIVNGSADDESDDIISEEQLYDFLCETVSGLDPESVTKVSVDKVVDKVTSRYSPKSAENLERLKSALSVMAYAYMSGVLKQRAESQFNEMRKRKDETK